MGPTALIALLALKATIGMKCGLINREKRGRNIPLAIFVLNVHPDLKKDARLEVRNRGQLKLDTLMQFALSRSIIGLKIQAMKYMNVEIILSIPIIVMVALEQVKTHAPIMLKVTCAISAKMIIFTIRMGNVLNVKSMI